MKFVKFIIPALVALTGCQKYVDIKTQGQLVPGATENYRYLLNDNYTFEQWVRLPDIASDDIHIKDQTQMDQLLAFSSYLYYTNTYTWQNAIYTVPGDTDPDWDRMYKVIYNANLIITETPGSTGGTEAEKAEIIAEAKVHRADAYLTLVNMYAKPYNAGSAATDPGVPLLTTPTMDAPLTRNPVATVYEQILADLSSAYPVLPPTNTFKILPSKAAAFALLARTHLYMSNAAEAGRWADSALKIQNTLNDLATLSTFDYPVRLSDPELILSRLAGESYTYGPRVLRLSDSLLNLLGTDDLRYTFFTTAGTDFDASFTGRFFNKERIGNWETRNIGPSVPEMMLIKAEALARAGDATGALTLVNNLRRKRFTADTYTAITAANAQEALVEVIKEKQRELFCRGLRWYDMRRLKDEPAFSHTITREFNGNTYTLAPNSNRYVFPIADYYRTFNPGITNNP
ncbi:MAG: RagB/SusD family nutrient uptake outer membrane protein [Candidatus Pseudobacter hemicellulosilyticus]|uniref:RagB/SusD family nutrient uptake outer membrane protein n=1 Tax=Candidatus Pseudobacter hemicellulosilyticus TaxID=3121375 RepID=A0AAJ5WTK5_9BACT|nr:MAG: RagB/SusD family nutrient uptake outer membrane protein [Pseudobacter sp.]